MRLFGTDGIRGEVGKYPLTPENVLKLADKYNYKILTTEKDILRIDFQDLNINKINYIKSDLEIIDEEKLNKIILSI